MNRFAVLMSMVFFLLWSSCTSAVSIHETKSPDRLPSPGVISKFGESEFDTSGEIPIVTLRGTHEEMGLAFGVLTREYSQGVFERIKSLRALFVKKSKLGFLAQWFASSTTMEFESKFSDQHRKELQSFAKGAEIPYEDAILLQAIHEAINVGCTSILQADEKALLHGRNLDYPFHFLGQYPLMVRFQGDGERAYTALSFAGYLGVLTGINDAGISVSVNAVSLAKNSRPKSEVLGFVLRDMLARASTGEEASANLKTCVPSVGWIVTIGDARQKTGMMVDLAPTGTVVHDLVEGTPLVAENRFIDATMRNLMSVQTGGAAGHAMREARVRGNLEGKKNDIAAFTGALCDAELGNSGTVIGAGNMTVNRDSTVLLCVFDYSNDRAIIAYAPGFAPWSRLYSVSLSSGRIDPYREAVSTYPAAREMAARIAGEMEPSFLEDPEGFLAAAGDGSKLITLNEIQVFSALVMKRNFKPFFALVDEKTAMLEENYPEIAAALVTRAHWLAFSGKGEQAAVLYEQAFTCPFIGDADIAEIATFLFYRYRTIETDRARIWAQRGIAALAGYTPRAAERQILSDMGTFVHVH